MKPLRSANLLLRRYLVQACAYHSLGASIVEDARFDADARELAARWNEVTDPARALVDITSLRRNSSGYYIKFTQRIINAAREQLRTQRVPIFRKQQKTKKPKQMLWL